MREDTIKPMSSKSPIKRIAQTHVDHKFWRSEFSWLGKCKQVVIPDITMEMRWSKSPCVESGKLYGGEVDIIKCLIGACFVFTKMKKEDSLHARMDWWGPVKGAQGCRACQDCQLVLSMSVLAWWAAVDNVLPPTKGFPLCLHQGPWRMWSVGNRKISKAKHCRGARVSSKLAMPCMHAQSLSHRT